MTPNSCHPSLPPLPFCVSKSSLSLGGRSLASGVAAQSSAGTWRVAPGGRLLEAMVWAWGDGLARG